MLATRVITAVVALVVVVAMVFLAPRALWALFMLAVALVSCWEWSRLCGLAEGVRIAYLVLSVAAGAALWAFSVSAPAGAFAHVTVVLFAIAAIFWVAIAPFWIGGHWKPAPAMRALAGWVVVWPTWAATVVLREASPWILLAAAALVWVADIAAYFSGRRFGKRKLAPAVSPGKTVEGLLGALAGVFVYGVVLALLARARPMPFSDLFQADAGIPAIVAMVALALLSVVGDLFESWMKRGAGRKDSSGLLPGHGGMLDRIDALTSTLPVAALVLTLRAFLP
ncbi:MAG TPA: phosphatidate cytidylyltransferase [Usitatibacter sp.]|nr:phosphatidate cytidylyltransferase [Usitatibacter sp.]